MPFTKLLPSKKVVTTNPIGDLTAQITQIQQTKSLSDESYGHMAITTESMGSNEEQVLISTANSMKSTIDSIIEGFGNIAVEDHNVEAATLAGILATSPREVLSSKLRGVSTEAVNVMAGVQDGHMERPFTMEAYDERENRNAQTYSIVYNLLASRQDEFGETFFPTIVINPTEVGALISIKLFMVYNDFKRSVSGALADYGRVNVIRAYANSEVLRNELTRAVPVLRQGSGADNNESVFVEVAKVPATEVNLGNNVTVQTGALKVDQKVDLIGLSQTNELLNSGLMGPDDNLDAYIKLAAVYLEAGDDVIRIPLEDIQGSLLTHSVQGNSRRMLLDLDTNSVTMDEDTRSVTGDPLATLTELSNHSARIQLNVSGSVTLDTSACIVNRGTVSLATLRNSNGDLASQGTFNALAGKLAAANVIGYDIRAYRANSNIRQRGQLLDSQTEYRVVQVPYRSPISVIAPVMGVAGEDTTALQTLITTTGIRTSNEAVTELLRADAGLAAYNPVADANGTLPELAAIGSNYVNPVYFQDTMDLGVNVDSLKSHERLKDIRAAIVERIRFFANEMFRNSEYKSAADVLTGNIGFKPTVIVGTDPVIYNYIQAEGDLRTLGEKFDVKVVATVDDRMKGKIFVSFGVFDGSRNTSINPLNFGNMLYGSEIVANMPVTRSGGTSNELIVAPRFLHMLNLPILTRIDVKGLPEVIGKVPVYSKEVQ